MTTHMINHADHGRYVECGRTVAGMAGSTTQQVTENLDRSDCNACLKKIIERSITNNREVVVFEGLVLAPEDTLLVVAKEDVTMQQMEDYSELLKNKLGDRVVMFSNDFHIVGMKPVEKVTD